ncbi:MAG: hypothetical protein M3R13_06480 [Armatimonadota bacterium]|nr:hypothetical protein [Armatimonadota bacterium]
MSQTKPQQLTARLSSGAHHYFFDLKRADHNGYLMITESRAINGVFERQRIRVEEKDFGSFLSLIAHLVAEPVSLNGRRPARSYEPWTRAEDDLLRAGIRAKRGIADMARIHERDPGAIRSRLGRLNLDR